MTFDQSLTSFTEATISEQLKAAYEVKLIEAKKFLGDRWVLSDKASKLDKPRRY